MKGRFFLPPEQKRPELRLKISSATLDAEELRDYFDLTGRRRRRRRKVEDAGAEPEQVPEHRDYLPRSAAIMGASGRSYRVDVFYLQGTLFSEVPS